MLGWGDLFSLSLLDTEPSLAKMQRIPVSCGRATLRWDVSLNSEWRHIWCLFIHQNCVSVIWFDYLQGTVLQKWGGLAKIMPVPEEFRLYVLLISCLVLIKMPLFIISSEVLGFNHQFLTLFTELPEWALFIQYPVCKSLSALIMLIPWMKLELWGKG